MNPLLAFAMPAPPQPTTLHEVLRAVHVLKGDLAGIMQPAQEALSAIPTHASQGTAWESSFFPVQRLLTPALMGSVGNQLQPPH